MGPLLCLVSATCFGAMGVFGKLAYDEGVEPQALVLLRFVIAAVLLLLLGTARAARSRRTAPSRPAQDLDRGSGQSPGRSAGRSPGQSPDQSLGAGLVLAALALGALGYATQASLYFSALGRIDASLVALVLYTYPALVTLAAVLFGRERLTASRTAALLTASCGTLLVLLGAGAVAFDPVGVGLALGSAVTYTVYILVSDVTVHRVPPLTLTTLVMTGAALALSGRALLGGGVRLDFGPAAWFWIACIAIVSTVVAATAFFAGLRRTGPSAASILSTFEPVATAGLAAVVLGEVLSPVQVVGGVLVLSSVVLVQHRQGARGSTPWATPGSAPPRVEPVGASS